MNPQLKAIIQQIPTVSALDKFKPASFYNPKYGQVFKYYRTLSDGIDQSLNLVNRSIAISRQPAGQTPWHVHNYIELTLVLQGTATIFIDQKSLSLATGQLLLIGPQSIHTIKAETADALIFNIAITNTFLTQERLSMLRNSQTVTQLLFDILQNTKQSTTTYIKFNATDNQLIQATLLEIMREYYQPDFGSQAIIDLDILKLLVQLIRLRQAQQATLISQKNSDVFDMLIYIENHFEQLSLADMAHVFHFHPNYLSAKLKAATGMTFQQLVSLQRLNAAASFLIQSKLTIAAIAERVGYHDSSYFYHEFKNFFDQTPTQYRHHNRLI